MSSCGGMPTLGYDIYLVYLILNGARIAQSVERLPACWATKDSIHGRGKRFFFSSQLLDWPPMQWVPGSLSSSVR
jgi:hypothetical protein